MAKKIKNNELTQREIKVIRMVCKDYTNKEIAKAMGLSYPWVDYCKGIIYKKIKRNSPVGMAMWAVKQGVVKLR